MLNPFLFLRMLNEVRGYTEGYTRNLLYTPRFSSEPNNNVKKQNLSSTRLRAATLLGY